MAAASMTSPQHVLHEGGGSRSTSPCLAPARRADAFTCASTAFTNAVTSQGGGSRCAVAFMDLLLQAALVMPLDLDRGFGMGHISEGHGFEGERSDGFEGVFDGAVKAFFDLQKYDMLLLRFTFTQARSDCGSRLDYETSRVQIHSGRSCRGGGGRGVFMCVFLAIITIIAVNATIVVLINVNCSSGAVAVLAISGGGGGGGGGERNKHRSGKVRRTPKFYQNGVSQ